MSKVVGFVVGAALIVVGAATGNVGLIIQGSAMVVTQAIVDLTMPKVPARQASEMSIALGEGPRVAQFGETFTPGSLVDGFNYGGKYGTDWECLIIRLADHKCEGLTGFYVNDEYNAYTGDGLVGRYDDQLEIYFRSDTTTQPLPDRVLDHGPGWTSDDIGQSGCDVIVCYKADKAKDKHPGWPGGRPRFGFVLKGALCYDPRKDDTVTGGSGAHRYDDPDTWEWSENPVICRYKWVRGIYANDDSSDPSKLLVGRGLTADEAPPENIIAAANLCDEIAAAAFPIQVVPGSGGRLERMGFTPDFSRMVMTTDTHVYIWNVAARQEALVTDPTPLGSAGMIGMRSDGGFYQANGTDLYECDAQANATLISSTSGFPMAGCAYVGGLVCAYTAAGLGNCLLYYTGATVQAVVGLTVSPSCYFESAEGTAWAVNSGTNSFGLITVPGGVETRVTSTTSGAAYAMDNGAGSFVVWQGSKLYLVDKATMTVTATQTGATFTSGTEPRITFSATRPGSTYLWISNKQFATSSLTLVRTISMGSWSGSDTGGGVYYDPINNALITQQQLTNDVMWRFLDRNGGFTIAGPIYSNQEFIDVEGMFASAVAGNIITHEGSVELEPAQAKSVVATVTDDDLLVGAQVNWNHGVPSESNSEWVNTVVARYIEPDQKWTDHAAPAARDTDDIVSDGRPREASITLRLVRHLLQAQRIAEINRRLGRLWGRATIKLGPRFCELEEGDWISWQSDRYGFTKTFRVEAYSIDEKWQITLTLREITAGVYADDYDFQPDQSVSVPTLPPPDVGAPDDANWTLTAITLDSPGASVPALHIEGDTSDDESVSSIIFEYWRSDGVLDPVADPDSIPWIMEGEHAPSTTQVDITSIVGAATYYAAVTYIVSGFSGDRLVLGPATVSDFSSGFIAIEDDTTPLQLDDGLTPYNLG